MWQSPILRSLSKRKTIMMQGRRCLVAGANTTVWHRTLSSPKSTTSSTSSSSTSLTSTSSTSLFSSGHNRFSRPSLYQLTSRGFTSLTTPNATMKLLSLTAKDQRRYLNLHEYQSKELMRSYGLNVQKGATADTPQEAFTVASRLKNEGAVDLILKCQVLAGGRGKGHLTSGLHGGVKVCATPTEVKRFAKDMIGYNLITHQTTEKGEVVRKVLIHEGVNITKELYLAIVLDRALSCPVFVASRMGGMDIEEVASSDPEAIAKIPVDITRGVTDDTVRAVSAALGVADPDGVLGAQLTGLYKMFEECDAVQVEINPLAITDFKSGPKRVMCVDAKIQFDDSAAYRQKELFSKEDKSTRDQGEVKAEAVGLNYVGMDGDIGCLVNGAGLAMATMDIIHLHGGSPANFLDVGGGADVHQVTEAFRILKVTKTVNAIFVNIFGGIMRCDTIAAGLVEAAKSVRLNAKLIVRLVGNNVEQGKAILDDSGVDCHIVDDFELAAKMACDAAVSRRRASYAAL